MAKRTSAARLVELIGSAYALEDLDAFRESVPRLLRAAIPAAEIGSYNEFDQDAAKTWWCSDPHLAIPDALGERFAALSPENPVLAHHQRTRDGRPRRMSDFLTREEFHATRLYREFYRHVGVEHLVGLTLPSPPQVVIGLGLTSGAGPDFTDADVALLAAARPHLIQAYRRAELATVRTATLAALEAGLDAIGSPVLVADEAGHVTLATPRARRLLERRLGEPGRTSWLAPDVRAALAARRRAGTPATEPLRLPDGEGTLTLRVLPAPDHGTELLIAEPGDAGMSVVALEATGLTRREAEAMRWLALGRRGAALARTMGISPRTVEKHLANAYAKLGVSNGSEAATAAWAAVGLRLPALEQLPPGHGREREA